MPDSDIAQLVDFAREQSIHLYLQPGKPATIHCLYPDKTQERLPYSLPAFDLNFRFHPTDFTQVNLALNRKMVSQAMDWLQPNKTDNVLDLFCGLGNFTLPLARLSHYVTGIEGSDQMVARAQENAQLNHLTNTEFHAADLTQDWQQAPWMQQTYDKILIDPPRSGALEIIKYLGPLGAKHILYVSCNPATLARDTAVLVDELGYELTRAGVMDMFPHTAHVEAMALFSLK